MNNIRLGKTNLQVTNIGVGCWTIGGTFSNLGLAGGWSGVDENDARKGLIEAIKMGANLFDTADVYGFGKSERHLGWALKKAERDNIIKRENLIIATKVGYFQGCSEHPYIPLHMRHQLEMSMRNLSVDYVDIYWFHHLDFGLNNQYLEGAIDQMRNFQKKGLIRFIGLRGPHKFSPSRKKGQIKTLDTLEHFYHIADIVNPDVITLRYNALSHKYDEPCTDLFTWAIERDIGLITYKPLAQGLLLDKYDPDNPPVFCSDDHRSRKKWFGKEGLLALRKRLAIVKKEFNCVTTSDLVHLFIKYCLSRSTNVCVLVGFRDPRQIRESLSTHGQLNNEECQRLRKIFDGINEEIGNFIVP